MRRGGEVIYSSKFTIHLYKECSVRDRLSVEVESWQRRRQIRDGRERTEEIDMKNFIQTRQLEDGSRDRWIFKGASKGILSSAWIRGRMDLCKSVGKIFKNEWINWIPIKENIFVWKILKGRMAVRKTLAEMDIDILSTKCEVCNDFVEDIDHLFFKCDLASWLWSRLGLWINSSIPSFESLHDCFAWVDRVYKPSVSNKIVKILVVVLLKSIWIHRNDIMFNDKRVEKEYAATWILSVFHRTQCSTITVVMETVPMESNALVNIEMQPEYFDTPMNDMDIQPAKRRKKKSIVWDFFTIENVAVGQRKACCKHCKQLFSYSNGSKVSGTSHLKRHIAKGGCPVALRNQNLDPSTPIPPLFDTPKRQYKTNTTTATATYTAFNPATCRQELARMIILHDYPLEMVEHAGFMAFVHNLNPNFEMGNFGSIQGDCVATYLKEKEKIRNLIEGMPGCISLTLDLLNTSHTTGYVFVTGQFIDCDWKTHRKLLNVVMEPYPDSDSAFSHAVSASLSDWNIEGKLFSLTINQPISESGINSLRNLLFEKNPNVLNGQLLLTNCLARCLTFIAQYAINTGQETVKKVRDCVKYVITSESLEEKFLQLKQQLQVMTTKSLSLDDQTQWNTTYEMLVSASELKQVFSCLDTLDPNYDQIPTHEDWKYVDTLCTYLKLLYNTAILLTSASIPTTNTFFHEAWKLQLELARASITEDDVVSSLAKPIQEIFDVYWKNCCFVLAIAVVMDPRFKMKLVEFSFTKLYGDNAVDYIKTVDEGIRALFSKYDGLPMPLRLVNGDSGIGDSGVVKQEGDAGGIGLTDFDVYIMESTSQESKSELDQYLEESLLPRIHEFDVMGWWKLNRSKYPTLSKMAHDVLMIPVSSVGPESVFEMGVKDMELRPEMVEPMFCAKDWLRCEGVGSVELNVKMEFPI
ncbi:hypothetical protein LXL04_002726 [Taraxacum kok-saghyz]